MPILDTIGSSTAITADGKTPSSQFITLWNSLSAAVPQIVQRALGKLQFVNVMRSKPDATHSAAIQVDTTTEDADYVDGLLIKLNGKKQLEQVSNGAALVIYKYEDDTISIKHIYDGMNYLVQGSNGKVQLNLDGDTSMLKINGVQVVKKQGPSVANANGSAVAPAGGPTVDSQARTSITQLIADRDATNAQINALLQALRSGTGHGLISA